MNEQEIIKKGVPNHIAIILDGNGRWAKKRLMPRTYGHLHGANNLINMAKYANKIGIKCMTVYCFSTENWSRPEKEVKFIMTKPLGYFRKYKKNLFDSNIKITIIGRRDRLSPQFLEFIEEAEENTKKHTGLNLVLAIDYGSLAEVKNATKEIAMLVKDGKLNPDDITESTIFKHLYTKDLPPLDLLIRTSGEIRISNFLLLQLAYSELYFTDCLWPDFHEEELLKAIASYQSRNRRFGGLKEEK